MRSHLIAAAVALILTAGCSAATNTALPDTATPTPSSTSTPTPVTSTATATPSLKPTPKPSATKVKTPRKRVVRTHTPTPTPKRTHRVAQPAVRAGVHPGAFCSPPGALGRTSAGTLMRCSSKGGDQARWRRA